MHKLVFIILFFMNKLRTAQTGFTLIELMVIVAILAVVASIALVSYSNYLDISRAQALVANYESAVDVARGSYVEARSRQSLGVAPAVPDSAADWVSLLNTPGSQAPGGGDAYVAGVGVPGTGAVGIQFTGSFATADAEVTILRPAYNGVPATTEVVSQINF